MASKQGRELQPTHKVFLVQRLACFATPKQAADGLSGEFGVTVTPQAAERYDPTKRAGASLAKKFVDLFWETREAFLKDIERIPGAHKAVRMARLERAVMYFELRGNYLAMADMTERQAKEMGNVHTNRRELMGRDGRPIQYEDVSRMTDEQLEARIAQLLGLATVDTEDDQPTTH